MNAPEPGPHTDPTRRGLLKAFVAGGGGLLIGMPLAGCASAPALPPAMAEADPRLGAFLQIAPDNTIHFYQPRAEMGQGVVAGMTTLLAEELEVDPLAIVVHHAPVHEAFNRPGSLQGTGGSASLAGHYEQMRRVGAQAREAIREAAALELGVAPGSLQMRNAHVVHGARRMPYGRFAAAAASKALPEDVALKPASDFRLIGKPQQRPDALAKATGTAEFGLDVDFPGLKRAALRRCPVAGGTLKSANTEAAQAMPGVVKVVEIFDGVAVVAETVWQARRAADALELDWELPPLADQNDDTVAAMLSDALANEDGRSSHDAGDGAEALARAARTVEATYTVPYLAHAAMEPLTCTVRIDGDACDVWVGHQVPPSAAGMAAYHAGVARNKVRFHSVYLGGAFGRRLVSDFVGETAAIAKASGHPVQLIWSREDDMRHGRYRPVAAAKLRAGLDAQGRLQTWVSKTAGPQIAAHFTDDILETMAPQALWGIADWASKRGHWAFRNFIVSEAATHGLFGDYDVANQDIRHITVDPGLPIGYWRSVGHSANAFFAESFIDEIAVAAGQDPLAFRIAHAANARNKGVLERAAAEANWGNAPAGRFHGVALHSSFKSTVAQIAEVSVLENRPVIHKVTCVIDCGVAVNPDVVRAQLEGGIVYGLTAALYGEISLKDGQVVQSNFHDYPMLRMNEAPQITVVIMESEASPTGVGEPGVPPIAPAVANALFAATGQRLRSLPLKLVAA